MLKIPNIVNTKVAKIIKYQSHRGSNHLFSAKSIKIGKEKGNISNIVNTKVAEFIK